MASRRQDLDERGLGGLSRKPRKRRGPDHAPGRRLVATAASGLSAPLNPLLTAPAASVSPNPWTRVPQASGWVQSQNPPKDLAPQWRSSFGIAPLLLPFFPYLHPQSELARPLGRLAEGWQVGEHGSARVLQVALSAVSAPPSLFSDLENGREAASLRRVLMRSEPELCRASPGQAWAPRGAPSRCRTSSRQGAPRLWPRVCTHIGARVCAGSGVAGGTGSYCV